ncbi:hypothetical protein SF123566_7314 [Shigella flexneri 1235-66]|nr:hypothetical protein SF123566_7314 [Shigella flexneri 1235-66]
MKGEKPLNFSSLRESLSQFDFQLEDEGQYAFIYKNGEIVEKVLKKGSKECKNMIKHILLSFESV